MDNKSVAIIMSTYNGEKYLKEQIDSLLNQTYKNITIVIRDDGSSDNTVNIINDYKKKSNNIKLIDGKNMGFIKSFFALLKDADGYDYYAYCDQDDIWMTNKIERAVEYLNKCDSNIPTLYFSNSDYYDENMNFVATAPKNKIYNFRNSLVECVSQGMTMVINKKTRDIMAENIPENCLYHDWWTYMICSGFGKIIYDDNSLVKYRRHNKSVTVEGKSKLELLIFRIKKFLVGDSLNQIKKQIREYEKYYSNKLNYNDRKLLKLFTNKKYSFINSIKKTFYPKRFRRKLTDEICVRILFLFGRL